MPPTSGIRSLPNETLLNIFLCAIAGVFPTLLAHPIPNLSLQTELERLANAPLLLLSRVCSQWHTIALGTPTLWAHLEMHGITEGALEQTIALLKTHLERSREAPLWIRFRGETYDRHPPHPRIFDLLAEYSHRWETVHFVCSLKGVDTSALRGRLPRLKDFEVNGEVRLKHCKPVTPFDFLAVAPCLRRILVAAPLLHVDTFGTIRRQINDLSCIVTPLHNELHTLLRLLPELSDGAGFYFIFDLDPSILPQNWDPALCLPLITAASLDTLGLRAVVCGPPDPHHVASVFTQVFSSLTLPNLTKVLLGYDGHPKVALGWPPAQHLAFLGLSERSAFGRCLKTLRVFQVNIAENQLMEILSVLEALESLEIGDQGMNNDSFLCAMTREDSGHQVAPRLAHLMCHSRLAFAPELFSDFVLSRLTYGPPASKFQISVHPAPSSDPDIFRQSPVHTLLRQLAVEHCRFRYLSGETWVSYAKL
ncbi:hypothetical protein FB45DRAFT_1111256 [Roridomyces roridus]|uniref:F-box domain-containing protein n=1 Tax=Roridomyces roridus TaxID=1738132 RepID=A0AAD7FDP2_9AGAR|nr:hypothetical protein FB45DRAFT_1111256 [Roridomyces roridus]